MRKTTLFALLAVSLMAAEPSQQMIDAVKSSDVKALNTLIKAKEDANSAIVGNKTLLMLCAWEGKSDAANLLLNKGANINATDSEGKTALMLAVWKEHISVVKLLIKHGADKTIKNKDGLTAADIAELSGNGEIIDFLKN